MPIIPLKCPNCGANIEVNSDNDAALCSFCGTPFVVKDAIVKNYISNVTNINLNGGTVNVSNKSDFVIKAAVLVKYNGEDTDVVIPNNVKEIGKEAFADYKYLTSVVIPDSVSCIGDRAFFGCSGLTNVTIPNSVTSLGICAFAKCSGLTSVTIPESVMKITDSAFVGCSGLTNVTIPDSVESIGHRAFSDCSSLTSITISNSVTSINMCAFYGCSSLTNVTIPESVKSIGPSAFEKCSSLTSLTIPNSVKTIEKYAFRNSTTCIKIKTWKKEFLDAFDNNQRKYLMNNYGICPNCGEMDSFSVFGKCKYCGCKKSDY